MKHRGRNLRENTEKCRRRTFFLLILSANCLHLYQSEKKAYEEAARRLAQEAEDREDNDFYKSETLILNIKT